MNFEEIKITSYLAGFHLRKKDFDFKSSAGKLFNYINEVTGREFEQLDMGPDLIILREKNLKNTEIIFEGQSLIYEDVVDSYSDFKSKAFFILTKWQELNQSAKVLRLAGIMRKFNIPKERPKGSYSSFLFDNYFKNIEVGGKHKQIDFHLNYNYSRKGNDYNINLFLNESLEKDYLLECKLDINQLDNDGSKKIDIARAEKIFDFSEDYYTNEFFNDINF